MTFFADISSDPPDSRPLPIPLSTATVDIDTEPPDDPYDPDEIEVGVAATEHGDGGVTIDVVTYIDGLPAPTYDDLINETPWRKLAEFSEDAESESLPATQAQVEVEVDAEAQLPRDAPHGTVDAIGKTWNGWTVIRRPQEDGQWIAMPKEMVIRDIRNAK